MNKNYNDDNVIINHKEHFEDNNPNQETNDSQAEQVKPAEKFYFNIKFQTKVFAILLMCFSALLFIALISYTPQDEANAQISFFDLLSMFSDDPVIKFKFDTTQNLLGLLGAYISNFLINRTIGYLIIGLPIFLFIWAWNLYKTGKISEKIITNTNIYIIFSIAISFFIATLTLFSPFANIPKEFYGTIGLFIPSMFAKIFSPIGALVFSLLFLALLIYKFTSIKKVGLKQTFKNIIKPFNIKVIIAKLNDSLNKPDEEKSTTNYENVIPKENVSKEAISNYEQPNKINTKKSTIEITTLNNDFTEPNKEVQPVVINIFDNQEVENNFINPNNTIVTKLQNKNSNVSIEDELLEKFRNKTQIKIVDETLNTQDNNIVNDDETINIAADNIKLSEPTKYIPEASNNFSIKSNSPLNVELASLTENEGNPKNQLTLDVDTPAIYAKEEIRKIEQEKITINSSGNKELKNPLSVASLEENIKYSSPQIELLDKGDEVFADDEELKRNGQILQEKLKTFNIEISNLAVTRGPVVTQYEFELADGIKVSRVEGLADDLTMALKAKSIRILAPVPEKGTVGVQIPNSNPSIVRFRSVVSSDKFASSKFELPLALGKTVSGEPFVADLTRMPHLLIAGSTGSGKSVGINTIINSLLYKKHPRQLKFIIIDPKKVELQQYSRLANHFLAISPDIDSDIVTDPQDAATVLKAAVLEMEKRYDILANAGQRNIKDYNLKVREGGLRNNKDFDHRELPYIVVIIDELADLMLTAKKEIENSIVRLAQMARATGVHLIVATQRPSVDVITGIIKANFPARIAYLVAGQVDSRTILDTSGAETLLGNGDMLFQPSNQPNPIRLQNPFISTDEVEKTCNFIGNQTGYSVPYMLPSTFTEATEGELDLTEVDPLFRNAAELVIEQQQVSTSMLQRRLEIGYPRAAKIIDQLEDAKIVGKAQSNRTREVLLDSVADLEKIL